MENKLIRIFEKVNNIKLNENSRIFKEGYNYMDDYFDKRDEILRESIRDYINSKPGDKQPWRLVPFPRLKKIWEDTARYGFVRDENGLYMIEDIIEENIIKIDVNNELLGHTSHIPKDVLEDEGYSEEQLKEKWEDYENTYFDAPNGQLRISDYGLEPLLKNLEKLKNETNPSKKILYIDMILNVVHQRSDLASWFVEGGSPALSQLSGTDK